MGPSWLDFSSKKERQKRYDDYVLWSFPYGDEQRQTIVRLLAALLPKEDPGLAMAAYLHGRDAYRDRNEKGISDDERLPACCNSLRFSLGSKHWCERFLYTALVEADACAADAFDYPDAATLRARAAELEKLL
jgi:hypothetical protein